jgi:phosphomannomutase/phosphoglucomutase
MIVIHSKEKSKMRDGIVSELEFNSFDYFEKTLITDNGFREYDVRWLIGKEINPNGFLTLGRAYGTMMRNILNEKRVVVGHDFRSYSQELSRSLIIGLLSTGVDVIDVGLALTPMVYFAQYHFGTTAAMQVTASHNENGWTGIKIANGLSSTLGPEGVRAFKSIVEAGDFPTGRGAYESFDDLFSPYQKDVLGNYALQHKLKVVLSAGNGTAGRFAPTVLRKLGCEVVEHDCTPDWEFKRHNPNPEDIAFLHDISEATVKHGARIGIGIDGDGDRIGVVDESGKEVFSDKLGLLVARWMCANNPNRSFVIEAKCTGLFLTDPVLRDANAKIIIWKTGHSYMKSKVREEKALAGFEKSGHWYLNEPFGRGYDDAVVSAIQLLRMMDERGMLLSEMIDELPKTWQSPTLGAYCADERKYQVERDMIEYFHKEQEKGSSIAGSKISSLVLASGVRFVLEDGSWGLVRASSNKPSLVVSAESCVSERQMYDIVSYAKTLLARADVVEYDQELQPPNQS